MAKELYELRGVVEKIYDARAMKVGDERIGAPYQKNLTDVTTGGTLSEGVSVVVQYSVRGKWKNAESIQVTGAAPATPPASNSNFDPTEKGGKHNRPKPEYRHPDEMTRVDVLGHAVATLTATGALQSAESDKHAVLAVTQLAELYQAFVEDTIDAAFIAENIVAKSAQTAAQPAQQAPEPTPEAKAAEVASTQPGPAESGSDPLSAWLSGE